VDNNTASITALTSIARVCNDGITHVLVTNRQVAAAFPAQQPRDHVKPLLDQEETSSP